MLKRFKKAISILLVIIVFIGLLPMQIYADMLCRHVMQTCKTTTTKVVGTTTPNQEKGLYGLQYRADIDLL